MRKRVLIVEDDEGWQHILARILEPECSVVGEDRGRLALQGREQEVLRFVRTALAPGEERSSATA